MKNHAAAAQIVSPLRGVHCLSSHSYRLTFGAQGEENVWQGVNCVYVFQVKIRRPATNYACRRGPYARRRIMLKQADRQPALIPEQRAALVVGDRSIQVDNWPLASYTREHRDVEVVRVDDSLVIEPMRRAWVKSLIFTLIVAVPGLLFTSLGQVPFWLILIILLVVFLVLLRFSLSRLEWIKFDRRAKQVVFERRVGLQNKRRVEKAYPLESILAVQLLHNGRHTVEERVQGGAPGGGDSYSVRSFHGYELNIVLDSTSTPRLNLLCLSDWKWIRESGQQIGEFLRVPVIDQLNHGG
jgi:hypothetical protein